MIPIPEVILKLVLWMNAEKVPLKRISCKVGSGEKM